MTTVTTYRLICEMPNSSRISPGFQTRTEAVQFGRKHWKDMQRCNVQRVHVADQCGDSETLWRAPTPLTEIPVGYYGVDGKRYHVDRPEDGAWAGWTFVTTGSDYHDRRTIASVHPSGKVARDHKVLHAIAADIFARAAEYGQITGRCAACGRKLEDPVSRSIGMGPICRQKFGM